MRIAVDAMGGDYAPQEIVRGAAEAAKAYPDTEIILVGRPEAIEEVLKKESAVPKNLSIQPAMQIIEMGDHPAAAIRQFADASIVVANRLVKEGKAEAVISAGSTGAAMAASLLVIGRIRGVKRPAIATLLPTQKQPVLLLDAGANADVKPENLVQFAKMGSLYMEGVMGRRDPRVGLLNIGEEETKGNELSVAAHQLLKKAEINFAGNMEGRDLTTGDFDVAVCDGFVGNITLKLLEGMAKSFSLMLKEAFLSSLCAKIGAMLVKTELSKFKKRMDAREQGGSPLLGVKGVSIISHGRSDAYAIRNAIRVARETVEADVVGKMAECFGKEDQDEQTD